METFGNQKIPKNPSFFCCEKCDYSTCSNKDFAKHNKTNKHIWKHLETESGQKIPTLICESCNKKYKHRSGLWKHKKTCAKKCPEFFSENEDNQNNQNGENNFDNNGVFQNSFIDKELVMALIHDNKELRNLFIEQSSAIIEQSKESNELKTMMMEVIKNGTHNNTTTTHVNSHNKSFNLNFFLNETCKNAMNITDFVNSLQIQLSDLENVGEVGFVNGISNIIVKNLKNLDITQRPVHCTDSKRETLYVKDENKWEKEGEQHAKLRKAVKTVAFKNSKMLPEFRKKYPDCGKSVSKYADQYNKLIIEAMGGNGNNDEEKENKIIKNIAKNVVIEK